MVDLQEEIRDRHFLVTGGAGFIGSHIVDALLKRGGYVRVVDDFSNGRPENLEENAENKKLEIIKKDVTGDLKDEFKEIDYVIHLAARIDVTESFKDPSKDIEVNLGGTVNVLEHSVAAGVRKLVFSSSAAVYGDPSKIPISEKAAKRPKSPYGINKRASEFYMGAYNNTKKLSTTSLRFFNVYGPRQDPISPYSGVISIFLDWGLSGEPLIIYGDGKQTRDFIYVEDVSRATILSLFDPKTNGQAINIGTAHETSITNLAKLITELTGKKSTITYQPKREGDIDRSCADSTKSKNLLGFSSLVPLREGLERTRDWLRRIRSEEAK